jgi:hypothetical protein
MIPNEHRVYMQCVVLTYRNNNFGGIAFYDGHIRLKIVAMDNRYNGKCSNTINYFI